MHTRKRRTFSAPAALEVAVEVFRKFLELVVIQVAGEKLDTAPGNLKQGDFSHLLRAKLNTNSPVADLNSSSTAVRLIGVLTNGPGERPEEIIDSQRHIAHIANFGQVSLIVRHYR